MFKNKIKNLDYYLNLPWTYRFEWSSQDACYVAFIAELKGCMSHGETIEEASRMIKEALACHIEAMLMNKCEIPEPAEQLDFKGKFIVRTSPKTHYRLDQRARATGKSLNKIVSEAFEYYLENADKQEIHGSIQGHTKYLSDLYGAYSYYATCYRVPEGEISTYEALNYPLWTQVQTGKKAPSKHKIKHLY